MARVCVIIFSICTETLKSTVGTDHCERFFNWKLIRDNNSPLFDPISVTRFGDLWTLGNFLKPLATIHLPKSRTVLGNFCEGVKIYHISSEIIFGQLL